MIKAPPAHTYTEENLMRTFPTSLGVYENVQELWRTVAQRYEEYYNEIEAVLIYPAIDNMPEDVLDILAQDLKVDWYDYNYSLESKRELIKTSVYVHKFLGTPAAVERMLGSVFPGSEVEEWFDYGGQPHHFRVVIGMEAAKETANIERILRAVNMVKRLSSWLDGVVYRTNVGILIQTHVDRWPHSPYMDREDNVDGEYPWRSDIWQQTGTEVRIQTRADPWRHPDELEGTEPWRSDIWEDSPTDVTIQTHADRWAHPPYMDRESGTDGESPWRSDIWQPTDSELQIQTQTATWRHPDELEGTEPWRSDILAESPAEIQVQTQAEPWHHSEGTDAESELTGTRPWRADKLTTTETDVTVQTTSDPMPYPSEAEGKPIWASAQGEEPRGRLEISADVTVYNYKIEFDREDRLDRDI